jgi:LMBR1 domain-containing protein 1
LLAANRNACSPEVPASYCTLTIPTQQLWLACFIANAVLTFVVIPFAMFYYEADSELCDPISLVVFPSNRREMRTP